MQQAERTRTIHKPPSKAGLNQDNEPATTNQHQNMWIHQLLTSITSMTLLRLQIAILRYKQNDVLNTSKREFYSLL